MDWTGGLTDEQTDERSVDDRSKKQVGIFFGYFLWSKIQFWRLNRKERKGDIVFHERVIVEKYPPK